MPYKYQGNVWIDDTSKAYRREVARYLDLICTTRAGKTLLKYINRKSRWVFIIPRKPTKEDPLNAFASPKDALDAYAKDYVRTRDLNLPLGIVMKMPTGVGTGVGSATWVKYHPATWRQLNINTGRIDPGFGPGEILYHEMLHAMRMVSGLMSDDPVHEDENMDDIEEFYSILAANVYRSERGFTSLRRDHHGAVKLSSEMTISESYYEHFKRPIDDWFQQQRGFCMDMAAIRTRFNPFTEAAVALGYMERPSTPMALPEKKRA